MVRTAAAPALLCLLILVLPLASASRADTVHLKNGGKLEGNILEETPAGIRLEMEAGKLFVDKDQIERIERGTAKPSPEEEPAPAKSAEPRGPGDEPTAGRERPTPKPTAAEARYREFPFQMALPKGWRPVRVEPIFFCDLKTPFESNVKVVITPFGTRGLAWLTSMMTSRKAPFHGVRREVQGNVAVWTGADRILVVRRLDEFWSVGVLTEGGTPAAELSLIRRLAETGRYRGIALRLAPGIDRKKGYETALAALDVFASVKAPLPGIVLLAKEELERKGPEIDERSLAAVLRVFAKPLAIIRQSLEKQGGASKGR